MRPRHLPSHLRTGSEEQAAVVQVFKSAGGFVYSTSDPLARRPTKGISDLLVMLPGELLFWESKAGSGRLTAEQTDFGWRVQGRHTTFEWGDAEAARAYLVARGQEAP